jgi:alkylation response protein AidB-like acyl-CoA dehydrogenase
MDSPFWSDSSEMGEYRSQLRAFFGHVVSPTKLREAIESETGYDEAVWKRMAEELGVQGLVIPEDFGGSGAGYATLALAMEEAGRVLLPGPLLASTMATVVFRESEDESMQGRYFPDLATGQATAAVVGLEGSPGDTVGSRFVVDTSNGSCTLTGSEGLVVGGSLAETLLIFVLEGGDPGIYAVRTDQPRVLVKPVAALDLTRRVASIELSHAAAERLEAKRPVREVQGRARDIVGVLLGAEQVGAARQCLDMAVSYVKSRYQFGRPIGSFQAVKYQCANMLLAVERAEAALRYSVRTLDEDRSEWQTAAAVALSVIPEAASLVAEEALQLYGGAGFTWANESHLFLRRAKMSEQLLGSPDSHRERLASAVLGDGSVHRA